MDGELSPGVTGAGTAEGLTVVVVELDGAGVFTEGSEVESAWIGPLRGCGVGRLPRELPGVVPGALLEEVTWVLPGARPRSLSASRRRA